MESGRHLSQRGYAAHRKAAGLAGTTLRAVQKAIQAGRIELEPDGSIDPVKADKLWAGRTDPAKQIPQSAFRESKPAKPEVAEGNAPAPKAAKSDYRSSKAAHEYYDAELARMKCEELSHSLIPIETVQRTLFDASRIIRNGHEDLVVSLAPQLAGLTELDQIERVLRDSFRALDERFAQQIEKDSAGDGKSDSRTDL